MALDASTWPTVLTAGGYFAVTHSATFRWSVRLTSEQVRDLFTTFSNWSTSEVAAAAAAVDDLGGAVDEHYLTPLVILRRLDDPQPPN